MPLCPGGWIAWEATWSESRSGSNSWTSGHDRRARRGRRVMFSLIVQFIVALWGIGFVVAVAMLVFGLPYVLIRFACIREKPKTKNQSSLVYHSKIKGYARNSRPPKDRHAGMARVMSGIGWPRAVSMTRARRCAGCSPTFARDARARCRMGSCRAVWTRGSWPYHKPATVRRCRCPGYARKTAYRYGRDHPTGHRRRYRSHPSRSNHQTDSMRMITRSASIPSRADVAEGVDAAASGWTVFIARHCRSRSRATRRQRLGQPRPQIPVLHRLSDPLDVAARQRTVPHVLDSGQRAVVGTHQRFIRAGIERAALECVRYLANGVTDMGPPDRPPGTVNASVPTLARSLARAVPPPGSAPDVIGGALA